MRIIDADALREKCGEWYTEEGTEEGFIGTLKGLLDAAPTIDAIPVEWLEEHDSEGNEYGRRYISVVEALSMWQQEQEAKLAEIKKSKED